MLSLDWRKFEDLVTSICRFYHLTVINAEYPDQGFDLMVTTSSGNVAGMQLKASISLRQPFDFWRRCFAMISNNLETIKDGRAVLVTNARLPSPLRAEVPEGVVVWDFDTISFLVENEPTLAQKWEVLTQGLFKYRDAPLPTTDEPHDPVIIPAERVKKRGSAKAKNAESLPATGMTLSAELRSIPPGRNGAQSFEQACFSALQYLFEGELVNWSSQPKTFDDLHRFDLIARVASRHDFWSTIVQDHRGRYIIFEFKNYTNKISQQQIYTTEKYLFPPAMRSTAILISREGADRNATRVIHGAFREGGKLILSLDLNQVCQMLLLKDAGEDPTVVLSAELELMLMGLER